MADFVKKNWACGDSITADELNRMEQGIADASQSGGGTAPLIVERTMREATAEECPNGGYAIVYSHSWQEIYDALSNSTPAYLKSVYEEGSSFEVTLLPIVSAYYNEEEGHTIQTAVNSADAADAFIRFDDATSKITLNCGHDGDGGDEGQPTP